MTHHQSTRPHVAVKSSLPHAEATGPQGPDEPPRNPWVNRVPITFADARTNGGIGHRFGWMILVLEGYCRARPYCWVSNAALAHAFGCGITALKDILRQMERAGLIHRVPNDERRPGRAGIVLLRRANPDLPVARRASLPEIVARMRGRETDPSGGGKPAPSRGRETGPLRTTLIPNEDESEETTLTFARAPGEDPQPAANEGAEVRPAPTEITEVNPAIAEVTTGLSADRASPPAAEAEPTPTCEQLEAEIAVLEAKVARRAPHPPEAMDRIRLKNLRDMRDGTWKADTPAGVTPSPPPSPTPRLGSWPVTVGPHTSSPPVETADLIRRCGRPGAGADAVEAAARRVAERLGDGHSLGYYRKTFARVRSGELPLSRALSAWKAASGGTARVPGSVFNAYLKGAVRGDRTGAVPGPVLADGCRRTAVAT